MPSNFASASLQEDLNESNSQEILQKEVLIRQLKEKLQPLLNELTNTVCNFVTCMNRISSTSTSSKTTLEKSCRASKESRKLSKSSSNGINKNPKKFYKTSANATSPFRPETTENTRLKRSTDSSKNHRESYNSDSSIFENPGYFAWDEWNQSSKQFNRHAIQKSSASYSKDYSPNELLDQSSGDVLAPNNITLDNVSITSVSKVVENMSTCELNSSTSSEAFGASDELKTKVLKNSQSFTEPSHATSTCSFTSSSNESDTSEEPPSEEPSNIGRTVHEHWKTLSENLNEYLSRSENFNSSILSNTVNKNSTIKYREYIKCFIIFLETSLGHFKNSKNCNDYEELIPQMKITLNQAKAVENFLMKLLQ